MLLKVIRTIVVFVIIGLNTMNAQNQFSYKSDFLSGYQNDVRGETINYTTLGAQNFDALLVRSINSKEYIEWETQPVPAETNESLLTFIMIASLQVNKDDSHRFDVFINGSKYFSFTNPIEASLSDKSWDGLNGSRMEFKNLQFDKFEDLTGFLLFHLPVKEFEKGKSIKIKVQGESASSRSWFMVFKHPCKSNIVIERENVVLNTPGEPKQSVRVNVMHMTKPGKAEIKIGNSNNQLQLKFGFNSFSAVLERIDKETELPIFVKIDKEKFDGKLKVKPVQQKIIYLLPHSHIDIGYTHVQDEVKEVQWQNIEEALDLIEKTAEYPEGTQFKWNAEVLWAVDSYLASASVEKKQRFINAAKNGLLNIDGLYANLLTGLCSPEEWVWIADAAKRIADVCDVKIETVMISDVPGWTWSMTTALAQSGIKYLSCGINPFDRIGSIRKELGDKPFYWVSPSGKEKILTWVHEQGYAAFHSISKKGSVAGVSALEPTLLKYANKLTDEEIPYDMIPLRYNIGGDNGPPDKYLPDNVKEWNKKYFSPKLVIATSAEFFRIFEEKYSSQLPVLKGDITPYWEDGAASSALETAMTRESAAKLSQSILLFSQYSPDTCPVDSFAKGWRNVELYNEHTWGSWNSISEPESEFTKQQWRIKQAFALEAEKQSRELLKQSVENLSSKKNFTDAFDIINTTSLKRTDLVYLPESLKPSIKSGLALIDDKGIEVPTQQLSDGKIVFLASDLPAFESKRYFIKEGKEKPKFEPVIIKNYSLQNEFIQLQINPKSGTISNLLMRGKEHNLVNNSDQYGLGNYLYVNGRRPDNPLPAENVEIHIKENGPLVSSWIVKANAPGCNSLEYEIRLIAGINRVDLEYVLDKKKVYTPEAVRIVFPFNVHQGVINVENAYGSYQPEVEQLKGSCKNFFTLNNYIDVSNNEYGISLISPDAPLVEIGSITNDANTTGWLQNAMKGTTVYSFAMNNYWHTNYCATQEGKTTFRYALFPHGKFNPAEAAAQGIMLEQPLVVVPAEKNTVVKNPFIKYDNESVFPVSIQPIEKDKKMWIVLYNASEKDTNVQLKFEKEINGIYDSDFIKNKLAKTSTDVLIPGEGIKCFLIER